MHSVSKHVRHGTVTYSLIIVSHSICFYAVNDCSGRVQLDVSKAGVIRPTAFFT